MFKYIQLIITLAMSLSISSLHRTIELNFFNSDTSYSPIFLTIPLTLLSILFFLFSDYINKYIKFFLVILKGFCLSSLPSLFYKITYIKVNNLDYFDLFFIRVNYLYSYEERLSYFTNLLNSNGINYLNYNHFTDIVSSYCLKFTTLEKLREIANNIILEFSDRNLEVPSKSYSQIFYDIVSQPLFYVSAVFILTGTLSFIIRFYGQPKVDIVETSKKINQVEDQLKHYIKEYKDSDLDKILNEYKDIIRSKKQISQEELNMLIKEKFADFNVNDNVSFFNLLKEYAEASQIEKFSADLLKDLAKNEKLKSYTLNSDSKSIKNNHSDEFNELNNKIADVSGNLSAAKQVYAEAIAKLDYYSRFGLNEANKANTRFCDTLNRTLTDLIERRSSRLSARITDEKTLSNMSIDRQNARILEVSNEVRTLTRLINRVIAKLAELFPGGPF